MKAAIQSSKIPADLRKNNNWVNQELTWNKSKNKYDKKPLNSRTGKPAKWSDPDEWSSLEDAQKMHQADPLKVPAYVMTEADNLVCIDLDDCYDGDALKPYAQHLMDVFHTYTERSVSGSGIHILCSGTTGLRVNETIIHEGREYPIEVFTKSRIVTLTGDLVDPDYSYIEEGELDTLEEMVKPKAKAGLTIGRGSPASSLATEEELRKLGSALQSASANDYHGWMKVGMALRLYGAQNGCEQEAWALFDDWSKTTESGNYDPQRNLDAWDSWDTTEAGSQVTLGTVYHMAKENGWTFDGRTITSSQNGQKGGRPPAPAHADTAKDFFDTSMVDESSGHPTTRYRDGIWHDYSPQGWTVVPKERIMSRIATFMQDDPALENHCTSNYFRSVKDNLASYNMCATGYRMPTWLDTGESGNHWMAFSDGWAVNMLNMARIMAGLDTGLEEPEYKRPVSPAFFSKSFVAYPLETEDRSMPLFRKYLDRVQPDPENQRMLQQMAGIALTDETCYETCHALIGSGANGKTVFLDILQHLIGRNNVCFIPLKMLAERFQGFPLAENKLNICNEMSTDTGTGNLHLVEGMLKDCISGGDIEVERKGVDKYFAPCRARFIFACNSMPTFMDRSDGIWRRLRVIDFPVTVPAGERDVHLAEKIIAWELPGVLLWAMEGLVDVVRSGMVFESGRSVSLKEQHRFDCDKEKCFLHECCDLEPEAFVPKETLYAKYKFWCSNNGYRFPLSKNKYLRRIEEIHPDLQTTQELWEEDGSRRRGFKGLGLKNPGCEPSTYPAHQVIVGAKRSQ